MSQAWITVGSPENFDVLRKRKFDVTAFKSSRKKQPGDMKPGDRIVFYLTGKVLFGGVVEVTGEAFEDQSDIGLESEGKPDEDFPYRIKTKPVVIAKPGNEIDVRDTISMYGRSPISWRRRGSLARRSWACASAATSTRSRTPTSR